MKPGDPLLNAAINNAFGRAFSISVLPDKSPFRILLKSSDLRDALAGNGDSDVSGEELLLNRAIIQIHVTASVS